MNARGFIDFQHVSYCYQAAEESEEFAGEPSWGDLRRFAVWDVDLSIQQGEFVAVIGRNGSGKSTMARLINALLLPTEGVLVVSGIQTDNEELIWDIRRSVGMVFQNPDNQIIGTSVEEDIAFGPENLGIPREEMVRRMEEAMETTGLTELRTREPHLLSGGQKQRVAIAGILAMEPSCIILDEATAMLDPIGRREVMRVIQELNREKQITIVHITHHMDEAALAQRVILVDRGTVRMDGTPKEVFRQAAALQEAGLEVPQVTQLFLALREKGWELPEDVISLEEARDCLRKAMKGFEGNEVGRCR